MDRRAELQSKSYIADAEYNAVHNYSLLSLESEVYRLE